MTLMRRTYDWMMQTATHRHASWWLAGISFVESWIFPIPADVALMPMCLADRSKAFHYAFICTIASVLGGVFGYMIGYFLFESVGMAILNFYGTVDEFYHFKEKFNEWGTWLVFISACAPIPYKVITIAGGVTHMDINALILSSIAGRALRFYVVAALIWKFGAPIKYYFEKYMAQLSLFFFAVLIASFIGLKYIL